MSKLLEAVQNLYDDEKIKLWNIYCEDNNYDQPIPADQVEEMYPLDSFGSVQECIQMYSSVVNESGYLKYDWVKLNGYNYLEPFDTDADIDEKALTDYILEDGIAYRDLPSALQDVLLEEDEESA